MKIKICGIRRREDVCFLNESMPDYAGFVFAGTKRYVRPDKAAELKKLMNPEIKVFGVFVNAPGEQIAAYVRDKVIDVVQLHGDESEEDIKWLKKACSVPVIKAVRVREREDILAADELSCDYLLLDTYEAGRYGGTGRAFSWEMIPAKLTHPYFLAGGLNRDNICDALKRVSCYGVDVSGGVETDGVKDGKKIRELIAAVRSCK